MGDNDVEEGKRRFSEHVQRGGPDVWFFCELYRVFSVECSRVLRVERVRDVLVGDVLPEFAGGVFEAGRYGKDGGNRRSEGDVQARNKSDVATKRAIVGVDFVDETRGILPGGEFNAIEIVRKGRAEDVFGEHERGDCAVEHNDADDISEMDGWSETVASGVEYVRVQRNRVCVCERGGCRVDESSSERRRARDRPRELRKSVLERVLFRVGFSVDVRLERVIDGAVCWSHVLLFQSFRREHRWNVHDAFEHVI